MKTEQNPNIDELLVKSMLDEASVAEQIEIKQWLLDDDDNQRYYEHFELIWNESKRLARQSNVDENAAWERFKVRTAAMEQEPKVIPMHPKPVFRILRMVAMVLMAACAGWLSYLAATQNAAPEVLTISSGMETRIATLPDGSIVTLNKKSSISYPKAFEGKTRQVALAGEAFFDVKPDKTKPFIIEVNDVTVKVLGTSFNVKDNAEKTEVIVETGIVEVSRANRKVRITPREEATVVKASAEMQKGTTEDEFHNYYRTRRLYCDNTPLWRLVEILNEAYDADIVVGNPALRDMPINTTFDQNSLESILGVVSETLSLKVEHHHGQIILK
ncbi:FecR family protein [Dyadobacter fermentans]|uniref:Anti-FecI sigma factor, FecR n=1 Tax=Dyadobacter fermentans (strain ATCC 700827 / DSM 18053 / CIP 107007 / KCTC 52180 / NS114) TaxID=471854 RepID=C6VWU9_DYAFD|nr:FecR domain-containing protein [Dyadobacter fermentans]ACT96849.1 anti-FecI sigma factor, FecR [Dyadobacter fermentans DSM 18053]